MENQVDKRQAKTRPASRKKTIVMRLLAKQLTHDKALRQLLDAGVQLPEEIHVNVIPLIANWYGLPASEYPWWWEWQGPSEETDIHADIMDEWEKVIDGDASFEDFVAVLCAASEKEPTR
jgi:hypothetical protein